MDAARYASRREKLRRLLHREKLGGLLVSLDANRFYLSGFELIDHQSNESAGHLLILPDGRDWLCTDARYLDAAKRLWDEDRIFIYSGDAPAQIGALARDRAGGEIGFEAKIISVHFHAALGQGLSLRAADGLVEELRAIKEPEEIARLEAAVALNHKLMEWVPGALLVGRTEAELAWEIERFFRERGAQALSFPCIAAVGENAALPHAVPGSEPIRENACVLVDVGCRLNEYCSDQTRTFWVGGKPSGQFLDTLSRVRTAQEKAIKAIRPGAGMADVYHAARKYLDAKGVGRHFTHGLGHGIGLQTHEAPTLSPRAAANLQAGMVVTVEPGLYYPEWGGVRWEYMVLVTEDGCRVL